MSRYVDTDTLKTIKSIQSADFNSIETIRQWIDSAPSIEIIRCRECKYASDDGTYGCMCEHFNDTSDAYHRMWSDDFCSYGERTEQVGNSDKFRKE